mmetsp:Transcript_50299/g.118121  ORF Transcript_50299/g.118121 Transcript_50299/m.118121 type:complete len:203 (+) Transcript_50299:248-856(+)
MSGPPSRVWNMVWFLEFWKYFQGLPNTGSSRSQDQSIRCACRTPHSLRFQDSHPKLVAERKPRTQTVRHRKTARGQRLLVRSDRRSSKPCLRELKLFVELFVARRVLEREMKQAPLPICSPLTSQDRLVVLGVRQRTWVGAALQPRQALRQQVRQQLPQQQPGRPPSSECIERHHFLILAAHLGGFREEGPARPSAAGRARP